MLHTYVGNSHIEVVFDIIQCFMQQRWPLIIGVKTKFWTIFVVNPYNAICLQNYLQLYKLI